MKTSNLIPSIAMVVSIFTSSLFTSSSFANPVFEANPDTEIDNKPWQSVFADYLHGLDMRLATDDSKKFYVEFMLNEKNEIIVFSTSDKGLDSTVKTKLNYKKIYPNNLIYNVKYTLPVIVKI